MYSLAVSTSASFGQEWRLFRNSSENVDSEWASSIPVSCSSGTERWSPQPFAPTVCQSMAVTSARRTQPPEVGLFQLNHHESPPFGRR